MDQIRPDLWLGGLAVAKDVEQLVRKRITLVISVFNGTMPAKAARKYKEACIQHTVLFAHDHELQDMSKICEKAYDIYAAHSAQQLGGVLVHCHMGISRSVTVVLYILMKHLNWSYERSSAHVKRCRPCMEPNIGFRRFLIGLEDESD